MNGAVSELVEILLSLIGADKEAVKALLQEWRLIYFWDVLRDRVFTAAVVFALPAILVLERFLGRLRSTSLSRGLWQNGVYFFLNAVVLTGAMAYALRAVHGAYNELFPFLKLQVLNDAPIWAQVVLGVILGDFLRYAHHWVRHKVPPMWAFHAVHHSDAEYSPGTGLREHFGDSVCGALVIAGPVMVLGGDPNTTAALGVFYRMWSLYQHMDVPTTLGPLGRIVVSPAYHRLHHSAEARHWDKNFGEVLTIWDCLFGTACFDFEPDCRCGVPGYQGANATRSSLGEFVKVWAWLTVRPFVDILRGGWRSRSIGAAQE